MTIRILTALALAGALAACSDEASSTTTPVAPSPVPETTAGFSDSSGTKRTPPPDVPGTEGMVRSATRSDATIAKPVITYVGRLSDNEISVNWHVTSVSNINDYRIQWAPGCITGWNRGTGATSLFHESGGGLVELAAFMPYRNWSALHSAFKVRIRARMGANTLTHRKGGPWSDTTLLYPQNTSSSEEGCSVGFRTSTSNYCVTVINGQHSEFEVTPDHTAKLNAGTRTSIPEVAHAAGESIAHGGFRAEARITPTGWEIVVADGRAVSVRALSNHLAGASGRREPFFTARHAVCPTSELRCPSRVKSEPQGPTPNEPTEGQSRRPNARIARGRKHHRARRRKWATPSSGARRGGARRLAVKRVGRPTISPPAKQSKKKGEQPTAP